MTINNQLIKENLIQIKALIKDPKHWIQGESTRDAAGSPTSPFSEKATCFCITGALEKVVYSESNANEVNTVKLYIEIMRSIRNAISVITATSVDQCSVSTYNDSHTHTEVMTLLDKAIELCI